MSRTTVTPAKPVHAVFSRRARDQLNLENMDSRLRGMTPLRPIGFGVINLLLRPEDDLYRITIHNLFDA